MKTFALVILLASSALAEARRPIIAYWVSHHDVRPPSGKPWEETVSLPRLVAYDDGLVIVTVDGEVRAATLSGAERAALFDLGGSEFFSLNESYEGTRQMHPPVHLVTRWKGDVRKSVRFFGRLDEPTHRAAAPASLQKALDALSMWTHPNLKPWEPDALTLRACRTTAPAMKTGWPKGWPTPDQGKKGLAPDCVSLMLPGTEKKRAEALVQKGQPFTVIRHQGAVWLVTLERYALPAEDAWEGR